MILVHPYCRIGDLVEAGIAKRQAASVYLKALVESGLLQEVKSGRENLYINPALLALLSDRPAARPTPRKRARECLGSSALPRFNLQTDCANTGITLPAAGCVNVEHVSDGAFPNDRA